MDKSRLLKKGVEELGHTPVSEQIDAFMAYLSELRKWNQAYNLTGMTKDEDIIIRHFLDSLLFLKALPDKTASVADVGSGAGFPGIPLKIIRPALEIQLIEPSVKKCAFLRHIISMLGLTGICIAEKTIEEAARKHEPSQQVDVAVTRALFSCRDFIKKASRIVSGGGTLILSKGPKVQEELKQISKVPFEIMTVQLPLTDVKRYLVIIRL